MDYTKLINTDKPAPAVNDTIYTPRFCEVTIREEFDSVEAAHDCGYTIEADIWGSNWTILGRSTSMYTITFAVVYWGDRPSKNVAYHKVILHARDDCDASMHVLGAIEVEVLQGGDIWSSIQRDHPQVYGILGDSCTDLLQVEYDIGREAAMSLGIIDDDDILRTYENVCIVESFNGEVGSRVAFTNYPDAEAYAESIWDDMDPEDRLRYTDLSVGACFRIIDIKDEELRGFDFGDPDVGDLRLLIEDLLEVGDESPLLTITQDDDELMEWLEWFFGKTNWYVELEHLQNCGFRDHHEAFPTVKVILQRILEDHIEWQVEWETLEHDVDALDCKTYKDAMQAGKDLQDQLDLSGIEIIRVLGLYRETEVHEEVLYRNVKNVVWTVFTTRDGEESIEVDNLTSKEDALVEAGRLIPDALDLSGIDVIEIGRTVNDVFDIESVEEVWSRPKDAIVATKKIIRSGGALMVSITKEVAMLGIGQGDIVEITLRRV